MKLAVLLAFLAAPVAAQTNCIDHATMAQRLDTGYGESLQSIAIGANGAVVEVFANLESGSWTITVTMPDGLSCMVASGEAYQIVPQGETT